MALHASLRASSAPATAMFVGAQIKPWLTHIDVLTPSATMADAAILAAAAIWVADSLRRCSVVTRNSPVIRYPLFWWSVLPMEPVRRGRFARRGIRARAHH